MRVSKMWGMKPEMHYDTSERRLGSTSRQEYAR